MLTAASAVAPTPQTRKRSRSETKEIENGLILAIDTRDVRGFGRQLSTLLSAEVLNSIMSSQQWYHVDTLVYTLERTYQRIIEKHAVDILRVFDDWMWPEDWLTAARPHVHKLQHENELVWNESDIIIAIQAEDLPFLRVAFRTNAGNMLRRPWLYDRSTFGSSRGSSYNEKLELDFFTQAIRHLDVAVFMLAQTGSLLTSEYGMRDMLRHLFDKKAPKYVRASGSVQGSVPRPPIPPWTPDLLAYILDHATLPLRSHYGTEVLSAENANLALKSFLVQRGGQLTATERQKCSTYYKLFITSRVWSQSGFDKDLRSFTDHYRTLMRTDTRFDEPTTINVIREMACFLVESIGVDWSSWVIGNDEAGVVETLRVHSGLLTTVLNLSITVGYLAQQLQLQSDHSKRFIMMARVLAHQPYIPAADAVLAARAAFPGGVALQFGHLDERVTELSQIYRRVALLLEDAALFMEPAPRRFVVHSEVQRQQLQHLAHQVLQRVRDAQPAVEGEVANALLPFGIPLDISQSITAMRYQQRHRRRHSFWSGTGNVT